MEIVYFYVNLFFYCVARFCRYMLAGHVVHNRNILTVIMHCACLRYGPAQFMNNGFTFAYGPSETASCDFFVVESTLTQILERFKSQESRNNLEAVLKYSPFRTEQDLKAELKTLFKTRPGTGTKIVLYNLKRYCCLLSIVFLSLMFPALSAPVFVLCLPVLNLS